MVKDASGADLPPHVHDRVAMLEANLKAAAVDAAAVPELRKQVSELRDALDNVTNSNSSPNGLNSKSAGAANANLQAITDRVSKLEKSLSATGLALCLWTCCTRRLAPWRRVSRRRQMEARGSSRIFRRR